MSATYVQRLQAALSRSTADADILRASAAFGLHPRTFTDAGLHMMTQWAQRRGQDLIKRAIAEYLDIATFDAQVEALRRLVSSSLDVASGAPMKRLDRRLTLPLFNSGEMGAIRQAVNRLHLGDNADENIGKIIQALNGNATA